MGRFHLMSVFVAVADAGSFSAAARDLGMSPPSVTRAINSLEERLKVKLLNRTTRSVRVTEAGRLYLDFARRIIGEMEEAENATAGVYSAPRGLLTVTAPVQFGKMFVTPAILAFLEHYPDMEVSALFLDRVVNLVDEGFDVAVRIGELPDSTLKAVRVGVVRKVVCASPEYLADHPEPQRPADLAGHLIVSATAVTPTAEWKFTQGSKTAGIRVKPRLSVSSIDAALEAVARGFGITRVMSYQAAPYLATGRLKTILTSFEPPPLPIHVLHPEGRYTSAKIRSFVDCLVANLKVSIPLG